MPPRVALITGCSEPSSLGAALALALHRQGVKVYATARVASTMSALAAEGINVGLPSPPLATLTRAQLIELDVTDKESIQAAVDVIEAQDGQLDILVNNAGVGGRAPLLDVDMDRLRSLFEVNTFAPLAVTQAFADLLVAAGKTGVDSVVLNVGSGAVYGPPFSGSYGASKVGLAGGGGMGLANGQGGAADAVGHAEARARPAPNQSHHSRAVYALPSPPQLGR